MNSAAAASAKPGPGPSAGVVLALIFPAIFLLHAPLFFLPYFWDEAGYYIPAARDLLLTGSLIPHAAPSNAHPPLVMAYLAAWWKLAGASIPVTRNAMLLVSAFSLLGVFRLARRSANVEVAVAATACTALYPVFFAQSTMALIDLAAAGLVFWGLEACLSGRMTAAALWFSLAVLAKETAVLAPVALVAWEMVSPWANRWFKALISLRERSWTAANLLAPVAVLGGWCAYQYTRTGHVFGNPEFFRYNVQATMSPLRILLVLVMRFWQTFGYMHLWVLTLLMIWAMARPPLRDDGEKRPRIAVPIQLVFGVVILAFVSTLSVVGGAVLARYMLTVVPLVIIIAVSTVWRRVRAWRWLVSAVCLAFVAGLFVNPPYGFSPEDNLAYRDYIVIHQDAESFLEERYSAARVLTAWPASDEISQPYLGYVRRPLRVVRIEDFTTEEVMSAAQLLGGRIVFTESRPGQWVAVIELERVEDAQLLSR